jgi:CRP-like cAMP-binding protein
LQISLCTLAVAVPRLCWIIVRKLTLHLTLRCDVLCLTLSHRDMDEWSLALLSCKLNLIGVEAGGVIKRRGDKSEYAYILLGGGATVR